MPLVCSQEPLLVRMPLSYQHTSVQNIYKVDYNDNSTGIYLHMNTDTEQEKGFDSYYSIHRWIE